MEALYEQYYETINKCDSHKDGLEDSIIHISKTIRKTPLDTKICVNGADFWYHRNITGKDEETYYSPVVSDQSSLTAAFDELPLPKAPTISVCVDPGLNSDKLCLLLDAIDEITIEESQDTLNISDSQLNLLKDALE
jgi:hypothetical protein